jgi:hypothetical protein
MEMKLSPNGWVGGIHHDETRVQQYLIVDMQDGIPSLIVWIDLMIMLNSDALIPAVGKWQIGNRKPVNPIKDIWITSVAKCEANLLSHKILRFCE